MASEFCEAGHCEERAVVDLGRYMRVGGLVGEVRFLCTKHGRAALPETKALVARRRADRKAGRCPDCGGALVGAYPTNYCPSCG